MHGKSVAVLPQPQHGAAVVGAGFAHRERRSPWRLYLLCAYNGSVWALLTLLLFAQVLAIVWSSVTYRQLVFFGRPTTEGMYALAGTNDELYADRAIVCMLSDHALRPMQLSEALRQSTSTPTKGIDGIRTVLRDFNSLANVEPATLADYEHKCEALAMSLDAIFDACDALGYNVTRDVLRIARGLEADTLVTLDQALPVVFAPFWDRGPAGRYVVPGQDGCACVFGSFGQLENSQATYSHLAATPRAVREAKTQQWIPGGEWRNGWYVDLKTGTSWFVHVSSSVASDQAELPLERFDLLNVSTGSTRRVDCTVQACSVTSADVSWGEQVQFRVGTDWARTVFVSNGSRFGLFSHEAMDVLTVTASYHLDQLISNVTLATLLMRWLVAMFALSKTRETIGVGALANSRSFCLLPLLLLPRLKTSLEGFWTAGCQFEGDQKAMSEAWFIMYPAIGEVVLIYFSVLNTLAKLLRRRVSDALFGPTLLCFGLLHYCRFELAKSKWLDYDGRISTAVSATEADTASAFSFITSDFAWRVNGEVTSLFLTKVVVLVLNLAPLIVGSRDVAKRRPTETPMRGVEVALAMRFGWNGGLGLSSIYESSHSDHKAAEPTPVLPYELVRGGYVVVNYEDLSSRSQLRQEPQTIGPQLTTDSSSFLVMTIDHWLWFVFLTPRHFGTWWRTLLVFRVAVFEASQLLPLRETGLNLEKTLQFNGRRLTRSKHRRLPCWKRIDVEMHQRILSIASPSKAQASQARDAASRSEPAPLWHTRVALAYHWSLWLLVVGLLILQPIGHLMQNLQTKQSAIYGQSPLLGVSTVGGKNDEPLTDRAIVCALKGRLYQPAQLSTVLAAAPRSSYVDASRSVDGYRVISHEGLTLKPQVRTEYANRCDQIATTLDGILAACTALGYDVSGSEYLRVVTDNDTLVPLPTTLPVLILPYWDNALAARYVIPSADGSACVFRLSGKYNDAAIESFRLQGISRAVRTVKTVEWLDMPGGTWHHGWYEDPSKPTNRFYSDLISDDPQSTLGIMRREFDTLAKAELDCTTGVCTTFPATQKWSKDLYAMEQMLAITSITVLNPKRDGLFLFEATTTKRSVSIYRFEMVIANVSMALLMFRWLAALLAMHRIQKPIGVGALACARSFHLLPVMLLPRLKSILAVFGTVGCRFEGEQMTLGEAGFVMYPTIVEFTLLWFSLFNLVSKLLRRRVSDAFFGPVLIGLVLLHRLRREIADSGALEMTSRVATLVTSSEYQAVKLADFFSTDLLFRLNGNITSLFVMKLVLLGVSVVVPLLFFSERTGHRNAHVRRGVALSAAEKALALRVTYSGGLGRSPVYVFPTQASTPTSSPVVRMDAISPLDASSAAITKPLQRPLTKSRPSASRGGVIMGTIVPYEIVRAGYVVLGHDALVSTHDWFWFVVSAPLRLCRLPARHLRMVTFTLTDRGDGVWEVSERPHMYRVTDARFEGVGALQISARALR